MAKQNESSITAYSGIVKLNRKDLEILKRDNRKASIKMVGILIFAKDVSPELVRDTIKSVKVYGIIRASHEVKNVLSNL